MNEFISLVAEMRRLQIQYFTKGRDKYVLMDSKKAESNVDEWLFKHGFSLESVKKSAPDAKQSSMF